MRINHLKTSRFILYLITLLLFGTEFAHSQCNTQSTILVNGRIIDGTGTEPKEEWDIKICDEKIIGIGPDISIPDNANRIDVSGLTVLPGLIDMHGHLYANLGPSKGISNQQAYLKLYLAGGVTTIYSPGEFDAEGTLKLQKKVNLRQLKGPDILTTGPYFDHAPSQISWINGIESVDQLESQFNLWKDKIDGIKVYTSITEGELEKVIELADQYNLPVTGHLESITAAKAVDMGIDGLEHGIFGMPEFLEHGFNPKSTACQDTTFDLTDPAVETLIQKIIENQVYISPTIVTFKAISPDFKPVLPQWQQYISENALESVLKLGRMLPSNIQNCVSNALPKQNRLLKEINDRGGNIVTGTDPVGPMVTPGYGLHHEMALLVESGLTPMEAIQAATFNAAKALQKDAEFGSIEVGKQANLVVVQGNPSQNINDIGNIVMIFKQGNQYDSDKLRESSLGKIGKNVIK